MYFLNDDATPFIVLIHGVKNTCYYTLPNLQSQFDLIVGHVINKANSHITVTYRQNMTAHKSSHIFPIKQFTSLFYRPYNKISHLTTQLDNQHVR